MSIAKNLAAYLPAIIDHGVAQRPIGAGISAAEIDSYTTGIYALAARLELPRDPLLYGKNLYTSLLNTLDRLISHRGCGTGITRTMWLHLKNIVMIHGEVRDWSNHDTGPILGALNTTIADRLALSEGRRKSSGFVMGVENIDRNQRLGGSRCKCEYRYLGRGSTTEANLRRL